MNRINTMSVFTVKCSNTDLVLAAKSAPAYGYLVVKVPNRIKNLRIAKGLTQAALAEASETTQQQIARLENGDRELTASWLMRLATALECHAIELLPEEIAFSRRTQAMAVLFEDLSPEDQERLLKLCDALSKPASKEVLKALGESS